MPKASISLCAVFLHFFVFLHESHGQGERFIIPDVKIEALSPKGIRVTLPQTTGVEFYGFHGNRNKPILNSAQGEISGEVGTTGSKWSFTDPNVQLEVGDTIYYWLFVQHERLGYRKENLSFKVTELVPYSGTVECSSKSKITTYDNGKVPCSKEVIFQDDFSSLDESKWMVEEYIPYGSDTDYEFVFYTKLPDTVSVRNKVLRLGLIENTNIQGQLTLGTCTRSSEDECSKYQVGAQFIPLIAGQVRSKISFKYGTIEIKAKLPAGDWIYPIIRLTNPDHEEIATMVFSRGNRELTTKAGEDIGAKTLYAWTDKTKKKSKKFSKPINADYHTFKIVWDKTGFTFFMDDEEYPSTKVSTFNTAIKERVGSDNRHGECFINLGIAAGGNTFFPDESKSGNFDKPWANYNSKEYSDFYKALGNIRTTWNTEDSALKILHVTVTAA